MKNPEAKEKKENLKFLQTLQYQAWDLSLIILFWEKYIITEIWPEFGLLEADQKSGLNQVYSVSSLCVVNSNLSNLFSAQTRIWAGLAQRSISIGLKWLVTMNIWTPILLNTVTIIHVVTIYQICVYLKRKPLGMQTLIDLVLVHTLAIQSMSTIW